MTHAHRWMLEKYEPYISKGACRCGAVRFFSDALDSDLVIRVGKLNREKAKEGDMAINIDELHPETVKKLGLEGKLAEAKLPPVPPRPANRYKMKRYYDGNKADIIRDLDTLGEKAMKERWGISQATWLCKRKDGTTAGLAARWGLVASGRPAKVKEKPAAAGKTLTGTTEKSTPAPADGLPPFPGFNEGWTELVKCRWFDTYKELVGAKR